MEVERQLEKDLHEDQRDVIYEKQVDQYQRNCPYVQEGQHLQNAINFLKSKEKSHLNIKMDRTIQILMVI